MYSQDLRNLAVRFYLQKFHSFRKTANHLGLKKSSIHRWVNRSPFVKRVTRKRKLSKDIMDYVEQMLQQNPFLTLRELRTKVNDKFRKDVSNSGIRVVIKRIGYSRKRSSQVVNTERIIGLRNDYRDKIKDIDYKHVISIDETYFEVSMIPKYGYSKRGERLQCSKSNINRKKFSLLMAITCQGVLDYELHTSNINKIIFANFIKKLQTTNYNFLQMDNVSFHHCKEVKDIMEAKSFLPLFTPPYSPMFNPIEHFFSMLKTKVRKYEGINQNRIQFVIQSFSDTNFNTLYTHCWRQ